jgi:hypothetical protein
MTAMLVDTPELGGDPGVTATIGRDEIEEALAADEPLDLILDVARPADGGVETAGVSVHWERGDLESLLQRMDSDAVLLSFDRANLQRALDEPDFEGHGFRETILLTVAAASASAAVAVSTASGQLMEEGAGGPAVAAVVAPGHGEAGTASMLAAQGVDPAIATAIAAHDEAGTARDIAAPAIHDEATLAARGVDPAIATAIAAHDEAGTARDIAAPAIHDEATLAARGVDPAIATAIAAHDEAATARDIAGPAVHDETSAVARGIGVSIPGPDESTLTARGIEQQPTPAVHDEATMVERGVETPAPVDAGTSFELPSVDPGTAAAIGGLAGAGLIIAAAGFAVRRNRPGTA